MKLTSRSRNAGIRRLGLRAIEYARRVTATQQGLRSFCEAEEIESGATTQAKKKAQLHLKLAQAKHVLHDSMSNRTLPGIRADAILFQIVQRLTMRS